MPRVVGKVTGCLLLKMDCYIKKIILSCLILILITGISSCDFFFLSSFPDYLTSVQRVENLDKYFSSTNRHDYDMFVIEDGVGNDFVFVLFRPETGNRNVIVLDRNFNIVSEYEAIDLGSFHASFLDNGPPIYQAAEVGSYRMRFDTFTWAPTLFAPSEKDYKPLWMVNDGEHHACYTAYGDPFCYFNSVGYNVDFTAGVGGIFFDIDNSNTDYDLEAIGYAENDIGDPNDDDVIIYLRRISDNEGIAIAIPDNEFDAPTTQPVINSPYMEYHFGHIKPGSVHIIGNGMGAVIERQDGTVVNYWYTGGGFNWSGETNGLQFKNRLVAYSQYAPEYYVFDPGTKDIFLCTVWWHVK